MSFTPRDDHASLGEPFFDVVTPATFPQTTVRFRNDRWAERIGLEGLSESRWIERFAGFEPFEGSLEHPLALRYHGHQFHHYNPDLGDGRGFLYAQVTDPADGRLLDFGTKGSGRTPWSRTADGRLTLKGGVREILATEMLEATGVYTSKTLSIIETHEALQRHDEPSPTRSCVMTRLSHSHVRVGTFQRLHFHEQTDAMGRLVDYCLDRYVPDASRTHPEESPTETLFSAVADANARLVASWMAAGFVHGVLNTDNLNITGESFDYGPWRFLPTYDPRFVAAYFDHSGLYAFGRQPSQVFWVLHRLADALSLLVDSDRLAAILERWPARFQAALNTAVAARLGVEHPPDELAGHTFAMLHPVGEQGGHFEQFFHDFYGRPGVQPLDSPQADAYRGEAFDAWRALFDQCTPTPFAKRSPVPRGPCEHVEIDEVERIWDAIDTEDDWQPLHDKVAALREQARLRPSPMHPEGHVAIDTPSPPQES